MKQMTKAKILQFPHARIRTEIEPCEAQILQFLPRKQLEMDALMDWVAAWIRMWT